MDLDVCKQQPCSCLARWVPQTEQQHKCTQEQLVLLVEKGARVIRCCLAGKQTNQCMLQSRIEQCVSYVADNYLDK